MLNFNVTKIDILKSTHNKLFLWQFRAILSYFKYSLPVTYNETCCREQGIPELCMGFCTDSRFQERTLPPNICKKENTMEKVKNCIIPLSGNSFPLK